MPEGDTIFRAARALHAALAGRRVTRFETRLAPLARVDDQSPVAGRTVEEVIANGKHLLMHFSGDLWLRTHMRMNGSWHIYQPGDRWQRPSRDMRIVIETDAYHAVGFSIPVAEFHTSRELARQNDIAHIGPDLLADDFDAVEAARRIRARGDVAIADVLLNQRVMAGLGNVFKSELLFIVGIEPFRTVATLGDDVIDEIVALSRKLMQLNVGVDTGSRRTRSSLRPEDRLWVYGRGGEPCRKCGTPIAYRKQGLDARGTYWCPKCQV